MMLEFNVPVFIVQLITFVVGMGAIWFVYLKPLGQHLKDRKTGIIKDLAAATDARAEAEKLKADFAQEKVKLMDENRRLMEKTKADAEIFRAELMATAKTEHEALLRAGRAQLEHERNEAVRKIREQAASLIVEATEKLLEKNLNKSTQTALAEKFVKAIKVSKN
jgi:F-type H+-transporting ATPase subunit b